MSNSPFVVGCIIPLMKDLNMSWLEIKTTPRYELEGLMFGLSEYNVLHQFDGYNAEDLKETFKSKPEVREQWQNYLNKRRKYGLVKSAKSFSEAGLI
tara:strand:+ start:505 stop:795 length:291 start_codon:yes stop_codon:yes gene_type:complete